MICAKVNRLWRSKDINIVSRIADEKVAHVAGGVFWFISVCQKLGRVPCVAFKGSLKEYNVEVKGPFTYSAHWYHDSKELLDEKQAIYKGFMIGLHASYLWRKRIQV